MFRGACREMMGNGTGAAADYRKALDLNPGFSAASLRLTGLLIQTGNIPEAKYLLSRHIELHPDDQLARGLLSELP